MRRYFLREGRIEAVELLESGSDENMIHPSAGPVPSARKPVDSFEIWSGRRFVYRWAALHADKSDGE
jgi:hypothetical protein